MQSWSLQKKAAAATSTRSRRGVGWVFPSNPSLSCDFSLSLSLSPRIFLPRRHPPPTLASSGELRQRAVRPRAPLGPRLFFLRPNSSLSVHHSPWLARVSAATRDPPNPAMLKPASDGSGTGVDQIHGVNGGGAAGRARTEERRHPLKPKQQQDGFGTTEACLAAEPVSATNLPWIFISTWNVGGYTPTTELNLDDFIPADDHSDIYVLGDCPQDGNSR